MTTKPGIDQDALDAAEGDHVEAMTGDQVRAALAPFMPHLRDASPDAAQELLTGATGYGWICNFTAPTRFGWRGKRYPDGVGRQIVALLVELDDLQTNCALAYQKTKETTP